MKKILTVLLLVLFLGACGTVKEDSLPSEFDASLSIAADGTLYEAVYQKREESDRLVFSSPEHLKGLELSLAGDVCTVTMGDVSFESENFSAAFDFLPISAEGEKTVGGREYKIYEIRGVE